LLRFSFCLNILILRHKLLPINNFLNTPAIIGQTTDNNNTISAVITKSSIADNSATAIFSITTTNETGVIDGGVYSVTAQFVIDHGSASNTANCAAKIITFSFTRAMIGAGTGSNSTISTSDSISIASDGAVRSIVSVTPTVTETSEYVMSFNLQIDLAGSAVSTAGLVANVRLKYSGFVTKPVITGL